MEPSTIPDLGHFAHQSQRPGPFPPHPRYPAELPCPNQAKQAVQKRANTYALLPLTLSSLTENLNTFQGPER